MLLVADGEDTVGYRCPAARPRAHRTGLNHTVLTAPGDATDRYARFLTTDLSRDATCSPGTPCPYCDKEASCLSSTQAVDHLYHCGSAQVLAERIRPDRVELPE
jgi:hypothetical protein